MPFIQLSIGSVHYTENGQGFPIVLLHANPGDSQDFKAVIPALAEHYRVLTLDWSGYGQSAMPTRPETASVLLYCNVLREFLTTLELSSVCLIGNSLGGCVAARLAFESPEQVRALVLVSPSGFTPHNIVTRAFCKFQGSRFALLPRHFAHLYLKRSTSTTKEMLERASTIQATAARIALNRAIWRSFSNPENDLRQVADKIKAPTLLMFGKYDPVIPADKDGTVAAHCIPSAQFVVLPCGHASFAELPESFLEEVQPFLAMWCDKQKSGFESGVA